jgi:hypothetical protein
MTKWQIGSALGALALSATCLAAPSPASGLASTAELEGCVQVQGQLPPGLEVSVVAVSDPAPQPQQLPLTGACYRATLHRATYIVLTSAPGWFGQSAGQLRAMAKADQDARQRALQHPGDPQATTAMAEIDKQNDIALRRILDSTGWPGAELVGYRASSDCWLLVQHAPHDLLKSSLPAMKAAAARGELASSKVALSIDRVLMQDGEKQLYGSQFRQSPSGSWELYPVEDPDHLDERRAQMGLGPFEQYRARILAMYLTAPKK